MGIRITAILTIVIVQKVGASDTLPFLSLYLNFPHIDKNLICAYNDDTITRSLESMNHRHLFVNSVRETNDERVRLSFINV